jgi:hypothetical protein
VSYGNSAYSGAVYGKRTSDTVVVAAAPVRAPRTIGSAISKVITSAITSTVYTLIITLM